MVFDIEEGFKKNLGWSALIGDFAGNRGKNRFNYDFKYFHQIRPPRLKAGLMKSVDTSPTQAEAWAY